MDDRAGPMWTGTVPRPHAGTRRSALTEDGRSETADIVMTKKRPRRCRPGGEDTRWYMCGRGPREPNVPDERDPYRGRFSRVPRCGIGSASGHPRVCSMARSDGAVDKREPSTRSGGGDMNEASQ